MPTIAFYFPYGSIGGVSVLFLRLAARLTESYRVIIMDLNDGYMANHLPQGCEFLPYDQPEKLPEDSLLILQSCPLWRIKGLAMFPKGTRIFFWNLHPDNLTPRLVSWGLNSSWHHFAAAFIHALSRGRRQKLRMLVSHLIERKSIVFMDRENARKTTTSLGLSANDCVYLPILTDEPTLSREPFDAIDTLECGWIGRLEDFKMPILLHLIDRLDQIASPKPRLTIVGDGSGRKAIEAALEKCRNLSVQFTGTIGFQDLDSKIVRFHALFAMGTSALEGAKLGIPTFCLDYSYRPITGLYRFRYIFETHGYNLGEEIGERHLESQSSLEAKISDLIQSPNELGERCRRHWEGSYSPEFVVKRFVDLVENSNAPIEELVDLNLGRSDFFSYLKSLLLKPSAVTGFIGT